MRSVNVAELKNRREVAAEVPAAGRPRELRRRLQRRPGRE